MGSTRVLESFGEQVPAGDVLKQLRWLFPLFKDESLARDETALRLNTLLRPACEYVAVAMQTHPAAREAIFTEKGADNEDVAVAEAVKVELATTVAVLLEAKFPFTPPNTFALLSLPAFVEEMEADESKIPAVNPMFTTNAEAKSDRMETVDEEEEKPSATAIARQQEEEACRVLCTWLNVEGQRMVAAQALAVMYRVVANGTSIESVANAATSLTTPLEEITKAYVGFTWLLECVPGSRFNCCFMRRLTDTEIVALPDFEFVNALLETVRDICLYQQRLSTPTQEGAFKAMSNVMPRLEAALAQFSKKHSPERRSAKGACSAIRHTLVEAFLAWLHHPDTANLLTSQVDFLHNVAGTLADPRVYGDVLAVLRASNVLEASAEYATGRQLAVVTLCEAINQLDRYSKSTANRIVSGLTRLAAACREDIHPLANELVLPLLPSMLDGSQWGNAPMRLSGRQQTLLSIYGAGNDGRKRISKKPQRPTSTPVVAPQSNSRRRSAPYLRSESKEHRVDDVGGNNTAGENPLVPLEAPPSEARIPACEERHPLDIFEPDPSRKTRRSTLMAKDELATAAVSTKGGTNAIVENEGAVVSLYGDGFIEVPLSADASTESNDTKPSRFLGDSGFSISILLFKAADTEKHKTKVYKLTIERPSTADELFSDFFYLWFGSTEKLMEHVIKHLSWTTQVNLCGGCVAAARIVGSKLQEKYHVDCSYVCASTGLSESTPKLLTAKLRTENSDGDETTFSIYDRGVLPNYRDKGEDGGCRVRWRKWECWANEYEVPCNRWVNLRIVFDCRYLQIFFDNELVDCARIRPIEASSPSSNSPRGRRGGGSSAWVQAPSSSNSVYVGGHPSYARSVRDWRARIGFVGLIASFKIWKVSSDLGQKRNGVNDDPLVSLTIPEVGAVRDNSSFQNVVNIHRNVFWRTNAPPIWTPITQAASAVCGVSSTTKGSIVLLSNFFDGAHCDIGFASPKSFENLLLTALQAGDIRVIIEYAMEFSVQRSHDHVCRSQVEYEQKSNALVVGIEQMSPLLSVAVNYEGVRPPMGSFEITVELTRAPGRKPVVVVLHSMNSTGCFPQLDDVKKKIESIVLFEAKRSPGEEIQIQAFRHLLALAGQTRQNRERTFMESVINRKLVLTERKVSVEFEKIGFFFASIELQEVVSYLKRIQDNYSKAQNHRMDDLPNLSMLTPTPTGLYTLPFMNTLLFSSTMACDNGAPKSPWRFVCILVDYDFQLVDFIHESCSVTKRGGISYRQGQSIYNGIVDRVYLRLTALSSKVFCILFSLQKIAEEENANDINNPQLTENTRIPNQLSGVRIQLENVEERHVLGMFDARPNPGCRWFTLAAAYRSKKINQWHLQAIGSCGYATSIYASIDELNVTLAELRIIQTYEIQVYFIETEKEKGTREDHECEEFARRLAKNIRFGRNGRIMLIPMADTDSKYRLRITLKLQEVEHKIDVYTHRNATNRTLPTIQSVYRTLLRILSQHGIKECLQQNPFAPQNKRVRRHVEFRVVSAQTNAPVEKVHVFIEKNISFDALNSNLAKTVLPTLMVGSRLMSIRRRLQKKRAIEITQKVAEAFVTDCIAKVSKRATIAANLNVRLISVVRARALLRRAMRVRYEKIEGCIIERARKSEHAREYSKSVPIRLQRLFTNPLVLSESERDLLQHSTRGELADLDLMLRGIVVPFKAKSELDEFALLEEWRSKKAQFVLEDRSEDSSKRSESNEMSPPDNQATSECQDSKPPVEGIKDRRQLFVTDSEGRTNCRLIPGSYSLYVFHLDYFEWTSHIAVYPTISASGLYTGMTTATSSVQEIVIPLDVYRWTYSLQLVDYFHPHISIKLAGIPLQVTNNCSSERQVVMTDSSGCATWEVSKGLYAVDVLRECSCVLYSALKQVVVDGGRYRTSRTITMPVLFGGVRVTVLVAIIAPVLDTTSKAAGIATIRFHPASSIGSIESAAAGKRRNAKIPLSCDLSAKDEQSDGDVAVGSSKAFKLRLGTYRMEVTVPEHISVSLPVKVTWASSRTQTNDGNRYLAVLSPIISEQKTFRIILSYVDGLESMDVIVEVWKNKTMIGHVWRQNPEECASHAKLETISHIESCEFQSILLYCQEGFEYRCVVANESMVYRLPQIQIYSSKGLIFQSSELPLVGELYWYVGLWDTSGEFTQRYDNWTEELEDEDEAEEVQREVRADFRRFGELHAFDIVREENEKELVGDVVLVFQDAGAAASAFTAFNGNVFGGKTVACIWEDTVGEEVARTKVEVRGMVMPEELEDPDEAAEVNEEMMQIFGRHGEVAELRLSEVTGDATVSFCNESAGRKAVQAINGSRYGGRLLTAVLLKESGDGFYSVEHEKATPEQETKPTLAPIVQVSTDIRP
ncbi:unnamed protein product [Phytophthora lilii]|uniref:Unnamed protein product n=1 Tax=Phytophthora lilii TaxID=2077276 RepID=A0A9W6TFP6_9STRA|nr:unnamed protein product [Phytophthora lilii]